MVVHFVWNQFLQPGFHCISAADDGRQHGILTSTLNHSIKQASVLFTIAVSVQGIGCMSLVPYKLTHDK